MESNRSIMTGTGTNEPQKGTRLRRRCFIICGVILFLVFLIFLIILVLALTVFKVKAPQVKLVSASLDGVSPRISFPVVNVELNVTLNLNLQVHNPNYESLRHGEGKSILLYRENMVGEADLYPGLIPARSSATLVAKLTLELDKFVGDFSSFIQDVLGGQLLLQTRSRIPGRIKLLGIIKKHVVATCDCSFTVGMPSLKILNQECKAETKF